MGMTPKFSFATRTGLKNALNKLKSHSSQVDSSEKTRSDISNPGKRVNVMSPFSLNPEKKIFISDKKIGYIQEIGGDSESSKVAEKEVKIAKSHQLEDSISSPKKRAKLVDSMLEMFNADEEEGGENVKDEIENKITHFKHHHDQEKTNSARPPHKKGPLHRHKTQEDTQVASP